MSVRFCTSIHYWRTPVSAWERVLDRLSAAGLQGIDVYVPWACHEVEEGRFDFGEDDPSLDLGRFVELVSERGMWLLLRPGPQVNAELNNFGLPDRIVRDQEIQALGPRGRPVFCPSPPVLFPVPSLASRKYEQAVEGWFSAVAAALRPVVERANPVRLVQVDNETSLFFREAPFDQDYHPEALSLWHEWQEAEGLPGWEAPLRREPGQEGLRKSTAWVRFRQWMMTRCIGRFREAMKRAGLDLAPFSHNTPPSGLWLPIRPARLAPAVDVVATDVYDTAKRFANARDQVLQLRGIDDEPFAAEMSCGTVYFAPGIGTFDNRFVTAACLAYGLKGFNLYMGAGRDRWIGGLIPEGGEREGADLLHFVQRLIRLMGTVGLGSLKPLVAGAVVVPDAYMDHSLASFPLPGGSPALLSALGLPVHEMLAPDEWEMGRPVQMDWLARMRDCQSALSQALIPYTMPAGEAPLPPGIVAMVPTFRYLPSRVLGTILDHAEAGGKVIAGPEEPVLDERLEPIDEASLARWSACRASGNLVVSRALDEPAVKDVLKGAARQIAGRMPYEVSIRAPQTEILPHTGPVEGVVFTWIVATGTGPGTRMVLKARKRWQWIRRLAIKQRSSGGEFIQDRGSPGEALVIEIAGQEVHLVEWRRDDVE